jgi:hypothetical protein
MIDENLLADLETYIQAKVKEGFDDRETIIGNALDFICADQDCPDEWVEALVDQALYQHYQAQLTWASPTDCDRLDQAFDALNRKGIVARQHFLCCRTCGISQIDEIVQDLQVKAYPVRGYVFYDFQSTDVTIDGNRLYLFYGATSMDTSDTLALGYEVKGILESFGVMVDWDGNIRNPIFLSIKWQRRRSIDLSWLN